MNMIRSYRLTMVLVCLACMTLMIASCGNSDNSSTPTAVYKVEYVPGTGMNAPMQGKTTYQLNITKTSDNSPAAGLTPTLSFTMHMTNGDTHTTPADLVSESTTTPGLYNCTAYYLMASGPTMGTWDMAVTIGGETTTFHPDVAMAMGTTTVRATLKGVTDKILSNSTGTATENRTYYLFNDGLTSAMMGGGYTFKLFIAAKESIMSMPAIGNGSILHNETNSAWTISSMTVDASTDNGSTWLTGDRRPYCRTLVGARSFQSHQQCDRYDLCSNERRQRNGCRTENHRWHGVIQREWLRVIYRNTRHVTLINHDENDAITYAGGPASRGCQHLSFSFLGRFLLRRRRRRDPASPEVLSGHGRCFL